MDGRVASLLAMTGRELIALLRKTRMRALLPALAMTGGEFITHLRKTRPRALLPALAMTEYGKITLASVDSFVAIAASVVLAVPRSVSTEWK